MQSARRLFLLIAILTVLSVVWGTQASHADTFYVATDGDDGNAGTQESPFQTIRRGAQALSAGDTLIVQGGTYSQGSDHIVIPSGASSSQPVTVQAASGETVVLQATERTDTIVFFEDGSQHIIFDGFSLDANDLATWALAIGDASHISVRNCEMKNALDSGMLVFGHSHEFSNLEVHDNGASTFEHGLYIQSSQTRVESSHFYNHPGYGIHAHGEGGDSNIFDSNLIENNATGGIVVANGENNEVIGNTISHNGIGLLLEAPGSIVKNNTIVDSTGTSGDEGKGIVIRDSGGEGLILEGNTICGNPDGAIIGVTSATVENNNFCDNE